MRAIGYARCSTEAQALDGVSLDQQRHALEREAERRGWTLELVTETGSAKNMDRPVLEDALIRLGVGEVQAIVATRLDRVSRTVGDFAQLMARAEAEGWALVILDPPVDLTTPFGKAMAHVAAAFAQLERELVVQRTKEGLEEARRRHGRLGTPVWTSEETIKAMRDCKRRGLSDRQTALELTSKGLRSASGRPWTKEMVRWLRVRSPVANGTAVKPVQPTAPRDDQAERIERLAAEPRSRSPRLPG